MFIFWHCLFSGSCGLTKFADQNEKSFKNIYIYTYNYIYIYFLVSLWIDNKLLTSLELLYEARCQQFQEFMLTERYHRFYRPHNPFCLLSNYVRQRSTEVGCLNRNSTEKIHAAKHTDRWKYFFSFRSHCEANARSTQWSKFGLSCRK